MDDDILGPIDYLAVEFPNGRVTGESFRVVTDLVRRGIVRVLDLEFVAKSGDGGVRKVELRDVEHTADVDITLWQGAESDVLDQSDFDLIAANIAPGSLAGILVYENVWAVPLLAVIERSTAHIVGHGRIDAEDLLAVLDVPEQRAR
ncbi:MAG: DUF1269 domain-containing protein [Chloroflexi bacterium]|nr:DUF1269 domain-containing protein [Chloroflexota bacterium]